jgi:NADPH-dependent curcumin reductase CurA
MTPNTPSISHTTSRALLLKSRPQGMVSMNNFELREQPLKPPSEGEVTVETLYLSVDPTNRIWMSDLPAYMPPVALGEVMRAIGLGRVIASSAAGWQPGDIVTGLLGWQDVQTTNPAQLNKVPVMPDAPLSLYLGPLGMTGLTAWFGMRHIGKPRPGQTVVVSAAAGAVGSIAGQLARLSGSRVVGIAGSDDKCQWLKSVAGFDDTINYRNLGPKELAQALDATCPQGIDVYFENVGGMTLEAVLPRLNIGARIPLCGLISQYNATEPARGPLGFEQLLMKRVLLQGFIIMDYADQFGAALQELAPMVLSGSIRFQETIVEGGLDKMVDAVNMLFAGENSGKLVVKF